MKAITKRKPMALLGERRFMVVPAKDLTGFGLDWRFVQREFLTAGDAQRRLTRLQKAQPNASWCVIEFYLPEGQSGMLSLDEMNTVPLQIRIVGGVV